MAWHGMALEGGATVILGIGIEVGIYLTQATSWRRLHACSSAMLRENTVLVCRVPLCRCGSVATRVPFVLSSEFISGGSKRLSLSTTSTLL
jgi:hypothetical protein